MLSNIEFNDSIPIADFPPQSETIEEAVAKYRLKAGRNPPQNYDKWFKLTQEKKCLIDEYDQIFEDVAPFHLMSRGAFNARLAALAKYPLEIQPLVIKDGKLAKQTFLYFSGHLFKKVSASCIIDIIGIIIIIAIY